jgi:hypothetical protein
MGEMKDINQGDESKRDSDFDILMSQHGYRSRNKLAQRLAETFDANDINPDRVTDKKRAYLKIFEKMQSDSTCKFETAYKIALITGCSLKELAEVMFPNLRDAPQLDFRFLERKIDVQLGSNGSKTWRENLRVEILADGLNRLENVAQTRCGGAPIHGECETRGFKLVQTKRIEPTTTIVFDVMCESLAATEGRRGVAAMTGARWGAIGKLFCEGLGGLGLWFLERVGNRVSGLSNSRWKRG